MSYRVDFDPDDGSRARRHGPRAGGVRVGELPDVDDLAQVADHRLVGAEELPALGLDDLARGRAPLHAERSEALRPESYGAQPVPVVALRAATPEPVAALAG